MSACLWNQVTFNWSNYSLTWGDNFCPGANALAEEYFNPYYPNNPYVPTATKKYMKIVYSVNDGTRNTLKTEIKNKKYKISSSNISLLTEEDYLKEKKSLLEEYNEKKKELEEILREEYMMKQKMIESEYKIEKSKIKVKVENITIR